MISPSAFVQKWAASRGAERATAQEHFIDLCRLLDEQTPNEADPSGDFYAFEKGARTLDGDGFADVWLKGYFAWEYKGKHKDLPARNALQVLKALFEDPHRLKPQKTTDQITQDAARMFGKISDELRKWKVDDMRIARFVTRVLFCMFATDVGLLPRETFSEIITVHKKSGDDKAFRKHLR